MVDDQEQPDTLIHFRLLIGAGMGMLEAQRRVRDAALRGAGSDTAPLGEAIAVAEFAGWMALRSDDTADYVALAEILVRRATEISRYEGLRQQAYGQAIALLELVADLDEIAASRLSSVIAEAAPEAVECSKIFLEEWATMLDDLKAARAEMSKQDGVE